VHGLLRRGQLLLLLEPRLLRVHLGILDTHFCKYSHV
jgi:hypothetical protein